MVSRCPDSQLVGVGTLAGYRFVINERGVASIAPACDFQVSGLVWDISEGDEVRLDRYEGVAKSYYRKAMTLVRRPDDGTIEALVYIASSEKAGKPRPGYMEKIIRAATDHALPAASINELRLWLCDGDSK